MAVVKWKTPAYRLFNEYVESALLEYGKKTAESDESRNPDYEDINVELLTNLRLIGYVNIIHFFEYCSQKCLFWGVSRRVESIVMRRAVNRNPSALSLTIDLRFVGAGFWSA